MGNSVEIPKQKKFIQVPWPHRSFDTTPLVKCNCVTTCENRISKKSSPTSGTQHKFSQSAASDVSYCLNNFSAHGIVNRCRLSGLVTVNHQSTESFTSFFHVNFTLSLTACDTLSRQIRFFCLAPPRQPLLNSFPMTDD